MSWIEKIQTDFTITTGDGKSYVPLSVNASKNVEYNIATFEFKETAGTLVKRGTPRGRRYAIEIYFQGEDHLEVADAFEASANDPRPWTIAHPLYGQILVQPVGLTFDNGLLNISKITGGLIETISETPDKVTVSAPDKIAADKVDCDAALASSYQVDVPAPSAVDIQSMISGISGSYTSVLNTIKSSVDAQNFLNAFNAANTAIGKAFTDTAGAITAIQSFVSLPSQFADTVVNRIGMLANMLTYLASTVPGLNTKASKRLYETVAGTMLSAMIVASVTKYANGYKKRTSVLSVIQTILGYYNGYITNLDQLQSANGGLPTSFIPSASGITVLSSLTGYTVSALLAIAQNSKQERSFFLEEDSSVIHLAHRLYGLDQDDTTIDDFMESNEIGLNELLVIRKGRKIIYYV